jgi:photosystem II stability/assembly factor-like uncharacterized protein
MATRSEHILYIGTAEGLYQAEWDGLEYRARPLGLQGCGALRSPVVVDRKETRRIYAATSRGGVFRSDDRGESWHEINQGIVYKEAWSLAQHPQTGELVLGTGPSAIFKSSDGGDQWTECEQLRTLAETKDWTFPNPPHVSHVKGLSLCAVDPRIIFGAVEEGWLIRSRDGGKSWQNIKEGTEFDSHSVAVMPDKPAVVIATSGKSFHKSIDGGDHFSKRDSGLDRCYMAPVALHPSRPQLLLTAAAAVPPPLWRRPEGADTGFYRSENCGESWQRLTGGLPEHFKPAPRAVVSDPEEPNNFYVGMTDGAVWMTDDSGDSFRQIIGGLPQVMSVRSAYQ